MSLRLVVDHERPWLVPAYRARAAATVALIHERTALRVLAWREAKHQGGGVLGEELAAQAGEEPPGPLHPVPATL